MYSINYVYSITLPVHLELDTFRARPTDWTTNQNHLYDIATAIAQNIVAIK